MLFLVCACSMLYSVVVSRTIHGDISLWMTEPGVGWDCSSDTCASSLVCDETTSPHSCSE